MYYEIVNGQFWADGEWVEIEDDTIQSIYDPYEVSEFFVDPEVGEADVFEDVSGTVTTFEDTGVLAVKVFGGRTTNTTTNFTDQTTND